MYFAPKLPSPRLRFAVALGADFGVFASRASIIAPSSLALTVTTRAVGSRQFASHAWGGGRADIVFAPRAIVGELRLAKDSEMRGSVFWREGTYLTRQSRHTFRPSFWPKKFARNCVSRPHTIKSNLSIAPRASSVSVAGAFEFSPDARPTARVPDGLRDSRGHSASAYVCLSERTGETHENQKTRILFPTLRFATSEEFLLLRTHRTR